MIQINYSPEETYCYAVETLDSWFKVKTIEEVTVEVAKALEKRKEQLSNPKKIEKVKKPNEIDYYLFDELDNTLATEAEIAELENEISKIDYVSMEAFVILKFSKENIVQILVSNEDVVAYFNMANETITIENFDHIEGVNTIQIISEVIKLLRERVAVLKRICGLVR